MSRLDRLVERYAHFVALPWEPALAGPQRVWFVVYDPADERRLRVRVPEFEEASRHAGHPFQLVDVTDAFGTWMAAERYAEHYFKNPAHLDAKRPLFRDHVAGLIRSAFAACPPDGIVAVLGVGALFGLVKVSEVIEQVAGAVPGRLVVFFPGQHSTGSYRLLDARDGWNYLAIPITAPEGS